MLHRPNDHSSPSITLNSPIRGYRLGYLISSGFQQGGLRHPGSYRITLAIHIFKNQNQKIPQKTKKCRAFMIDFFCSTKSSLFGASKGWMMHEASTHNWYRSTGQIYPFRKHYATRHCRIQLSVSMDNTYDQKKQCNLKHLLERSSLTTFEITTWKIVINYKIDVSRSQAYKLHINRRK